MRVSGHQIRLAASLAEGAQEATPAADVADAVALGRASVVGSELAAALAEVGSELAGKLAGFERARQRWAGEARASADSYDSADSASGARFRGPAGVAR